MPGPETEPMPLSWQAGVISLSQASLYAQQYKITYSYKPLLPATVHSSAEDIQRVYHLQVYQRYEKNTCCQLIQSHCINAAQNNF